MYSRRDKADGKSKMWIRVLLGFVVVSAEFVGRIVHGQDVLGGDAGLDVVDVVKHVAASASPFSIRERTCVTSPIAMAHKV